MPWWISLILGSHHQSITTEMTSKIPLTLRLQTHPNTIKRRRNMGKRVPRLVVMAFSRRTRNINLREFQLSTYISVCFCVSSTEAERNYQSYLGFFLKKISTSVRWFSFSENLLDNLYLLYCCNIEQCHIWSTAVWCYKLQESEQSLQNREATSKFCNLKCKALHV